MSDLRFALRLLARNPGFAITAILTLALAIGANTTVFTLVNAALVAPLPFPESDRLALLSRRTFGTARSSVKTRLMTDASGRPCAIA